MACSLVAVAACLTALFVLISTTSYRAPQWSDKVCNQGLTTSSADVQPSGGDAIAKPVKIYFSCKKWGDGSYKGKAEDDKGKEYTIYLTVKCCTNAALMLNCVSASGKGFGKVSVGLLDAKKHYCMSCDYKSEPRLVSMQSEDDECVYTPP